MAGQLALPEYQYTPSNVNWDLYNLEFSKEHYKNYPFKWRDQLMSPADYLHADKLKTSLSIRNHMWTTKVQMVPMWVADSKWKYDGNPSHFLPATLQAHETSSKVKGQQKRKQKRGAQQAGHRFMSQQGQVLKEMMAAEGKTMGESLRRRAEGNQSKTNDPSKYKGRGWGNKEK